ncbi:diaminopimelate epimerase [Maricaulis sp.]|uniref:diaminopimelate epimerase n=1 Tax=Maricaulis sp. TaxID=1486257 RepID=UPI002B2688D3|nr:diaminopimelate epimerase [Maricaulis sp.]
MIARLMNGAGNKFILADVRGRAGVFNLSAAAVTAIAREHPFDQLLVLEDSDTSDAFIRIWNSDGDEVGACGNGTRAAAWALMQERRSDTASLDTAGGQLLARDAGAMTVSVDMGEPRLDWQDIPLARPMDTARLDFAVEVDGIRIDAPGAVSMGNPHAVFFIRDVAALPVTTLGPVVEHDPLFPDRVNAGFAQILDPRHIRLRVWERGAGITAACGTGACAALVAAHRRGLCERQATLHADGGDLSVEWRASDNRIILTGPVEDEGPVTLDI